MSVLSVQSAEKFTTVILIYQLLLYDVLAFLFSSQAEPFWKV